MNLPRRVLSETGDAALSELSPAVLRILDDYLAQLEHGVPPHPDELLSRHPEIAETLREYLASLQFLHDAASRLRGIGEPVDQADRLTGEELGVLGDYRLIREVGRGGMGIVYEAQQISLNRRVALKILPFASGLEPRCLQRFKNEAQAAAALHHQHIVPVYGVGRERGVHYYAMQFVEGQTLAALILDLRQMRGLDVHADPEFKRIPSATLSPEPAECPIHPRTIARLGLQAADALEYAHGFGIIHRDIKPANLLVDVQGDIWITDFGLAQIRGDTRLTMTGDLVGTLRYMSPEQTLAKRVVLDHRTDIYSLGASLYEVLTLNPVFPGQDREELVRQIAFEDPVPPRRIDPRIPAELEIIVLKALAKNPEERYASARDMSDDLGRFLNGEPIRARNPTVAQRARKWAHRHRPIVLTASAALVALFAIVVAGSLISNALIRRERDQARDHRARAEGAATLAKLRLMDARLAQAAASRQGRQVGQRFDSLKALSEAARLAQELGVGQDRRMELRNDAIASLALFDIRPLKEWEGWPRGSQGLAFDSGLERYAYSDSTGNISVRRVSDDRELARLAGEGPGEPNTGTPFLQFSPDGNLLAARHHRKPGQAGNLRVWDWSRGRILFQPAITRDWFGLDFSPDGRYFTLVQPGGMVTIRRAADGSETRRISAGSSVSLVSWQPRGDTLAIVCSRGLEVQIRDVASGHLLRKWSIPAFAWAVAWHPEGGLLATACEDGRVYVWNAATGLKHTELQGHTASATKALFAPDGGALVSSGWDGACRIWDLWTGNELIHFSGEAIRFSRDGRRLVSRAGSRIGKR